MGSMDHRCGSRHPLDAAVNLYPRPSLAVRGRIREASISGMFVEAPSGLFTSRSLVEVEVTVPGGPALRTYRWQAMVVRRTDHGIGLLFDRLRPPAIARLLAHADNAEPYRGLGRAAERATPLHQARA